MVRDDGFQANGSSGTRLRMSSVRPPNATMAVICVSARRPMTASSTKWRWTTGLCKTRTTPHSRRSQIWRSKRSKSSSGSWSRRRSCSRCSGCVLDDICRHRFSLIAATQYNKYKKHLIESKIPDGSSTTVYRCGPMIDLCVGPHIPHTGKIKAFMVTKVSSMHACWPLLTMLLAELGFLFPWRLQQRLPATHLRDFIPRQEADG